MVTVLSQQRPSRPRWALPAGLALLFGTLGMAAGLIAVKRRAQYVSLGSVRELPGQLRAALPESWKEIPESELPQGVVHGLVESVKSRSRIPRQLYLFRGISEPFALPSREGCQTLRLIARETTNSPSSTLDIDGFEPVGPFVACTARVKSILRTRRGAIEYYHLGRVAVTPMGQVFGVLIEQGLTPRPSDTRLLDRVCEHLTIPNESLTSDVSAAMQAAGFRFKPPPDVQAVDNSDDDLPRCQITGGERKGWWCLNIHRVPLIEDRQPGDLITDYAATALMAPNAPLKIVSTSAGKRELLLLALMPADGVQVRGFLWAARIDARTAVLMRGRCETDGEDGLRQFVRDFAAGAEVASYGDVIEISAARRRARQCLNDLVKAGLDALWSKYVGREIVYDAYYYGVPLGRESVLYNESESGDGWLVSKQVQFQRWGLQIRIDESWSVWDSGGVYKRDLTRSLRRPGVPKAIVTMDYRELRISGSDRVDRYLITRSLDQTVPRPIRDYVDIDDVYACEPLLLEAAAKMAIDPEAQPAIFTTTEPFVARRAYWILSPTGRSRWPGDPEGKPVRTVRLQYDYDPDSIMLYFDNQGTLLGRASDSGVYYMLMGDASTEAMPK